MDTRRDYFDLYNLVDDSLVAVLLYCDLGTRLNATETCKRFKCLRWRFIDPSLCYKIIAHDLEGDAMNLIEWSSAHGHANQVRELLSDIRVDPTANSNKALTNACAFGRIEVVRELTKDERVDPFAFFPSAFQIACNLDRLDIVRDLSNHPKIKQIKLRDDQIRKIEFAHQCVGYRKLGTGVFMHEGTRNTTETDVESETTTTYWNSVLSSHRVKWTQWNDQPQMRRLLMLNDQIERYRTFSRCEGIDSFVFGRGPPNAKVVFAVCNPSPVETKEGFAFPPGNWVSLLEENIATVLKKDEYHLVYIFPYYLGKRDGQSASTKQEDEIFLPYALQRILTIQPKVIVPLGSKAARYIFAGLNSAYVETTKSFSQLLEATTRQKKTQTIAFKSDSSSLNVEVLACPHPFSILEQNNRNDSGGVSFAQSPGTKKDWTDCFDCINPSKIRGDQYYELLDPTDPKSKRVLRVFDVMKKGAKDSRELEQKQTTLAKRKAPASKRSVKNAPSLSKQKTMFLNYFAPDEESLRTTVALAKKHIENQNVPRIESDTFEVNKKPPVQQIKMNTNE